MREQVKDVVSYYTEAGPDYSHWSKQFNMHFGYYRRGMSPFNLEGMLDRMNYEVLTRLALSSDAPQRILDMGCGLGATLRYACGLMNNLTAYGVTIVPWQAKQAMALSQQGQMNRKVRIVRGDFTATPFAPNSFDGVFALESSCYSPGFSKEGLVREMYRVLKPGSRFVVADAFL